VLGIPSSVVSIPDKYDYINYLHTIIYASVEKNKRGGAGGASLGERKERGG
jgi:hypothetical protein